MSTQEGRVGYRKALVTGGAGFIGSHLVRALLARGLEVVVVDNLSTGRRENVPLSAEFVRGDILDQNLLVRALRGVDIVFHQAARVTVRGSLNHFAEDARTNLMGTITLLQACTTARTVRKFVFASSMAVYADAPTPHPISESWTTEPLSPYGVSKLAAEKYIRLVCESSGIEPVILRYFNTFGPGQSFTPYVGVVTIFITRLLTGQRPIIFGDGLQTRDFVSVEDVVEANLLAMEHNIPGEILNIGSGHGTTVNDLAHLLCARLRPDLEPEYAPAQPGELRNSVADITKARHLLGYTPHRTLADSLDDIVAWVAATTRGG
jgi:UDP-glucose 4-epimerase